MTIPVRLGILAALALLTAGVLAFRDRRRPPAQTSARPTPVEPHHAAHV
jgi:hypothetical protein